MIIELQSSDYFSRVGQLNTATNTITECSKESDKLVVGGWYSEVDGRHFAIFANEGRLYVFLGNRTLGVTRETKASDFPFKGHRKFEVIEGGLPVFTKTYTPRSALQGDVTPFLEDEDEDFLIFVKNIINNPDRQKILIEMAGQT